MVSEIEQRFSSLNSQILRGVQACNRKSEFLFSEEHLRGLADHYNAELKHEEVLVAKNYLKTKTEIVDI